MLRPFLGSILAVAFALVAVSHAGNLAEEPKEVELFNGKDLSGWTHFLEDKNAKPEDVWSVEDGVLICTGKPAGYISTEDDFTNYVLKLKWRFNPEKGAGNSGVLLRMVGEDKIWPKSIEAQLASENAGDFWNIDMFKMTVPEERTKGRNTKKMKPSNEKPLGEWNEYEITTDHGTITLKVNGEVQNVATQCEEIPGKICLQSEGAEIHFKDIVLTPIE